MAFEDWLAANDSESGFFTGATIGSLFGPAGAAIGGATGVVLGGLFGSSGAEKRALREATDESYDFAQDVFSYEAETREQIESQYEADLSTLTATLYASGGYSEETYNVRAGELAITRDESLASLGEEVEGYREGTSYEYFVEDYERVTGLSFSRRSLGDKGNELLFSYSLGGYDTRSSKDLADPYESVWSDLRMTEYSYEGGHQSTGDARTELFSGYVERITPSLEQYEKLVFGDEDDRTAYDEYMGERVAEANKWYDTRLAIIEAEEEALL